MGTRGIIKITKGGETKLCQYTQFDCYPTGRGYEICDFVKKTDIELFSEMVDKRLGTPHNDDFFTDKEEEMFKKAVTEAMDYLKNTFMDMYVAMKDCYETGRITKEEFIIGVTYSRETGSHILDAIMDIDTVFHPSLYPEDADNMRWIEGIYTIDLDRHVVDMDYHGLERSYTFEDIKSNLDIAEEMEKFEADEDEMNS